MLEPSSPTSTISPEHITFSTNSDGRPRLRYGLDTADILAAAMEGDVTLVVNVPLALEYEATCSVAEHRLAAGLAEREVQASHDGLVALAEPVESHFL